VGPIRSFRLRCAASLPSTIGRFLFGIFLGKRLDRLHVSAVWPHGGLPRLCGARKGPAADGARFLPSTQIWSAEGSLSFRLPRQFRLRGVVPSPHGQKVTHRQGPLPAGAASSQGFSSESVSLDENLAIARTETTLRGWACRTRSAPGDRQGVGGASPLR
jgi:hypothetical protein